MVIYMYEAISSASPAHIPSKCSYSTVYLPKLETGKGYLLKIKMWSECKRPVSVVALTRNNEFMAYKYIFSTNVAEYKNYLIPASKAGDGLKLQIGWDRDNKHISSQGDLWFYFDNIIKVKPDNQNDTGNCPTCGSEGIWKRPAALWCNTCNKIYAGF